MSKAKRARHPERLQIFCDPAAEVVWAGLMTLDLALQHQVLRELASMIAVSLAANPKTPQKKIEAAVGALHEAFELLGHSPSVRDYSDLRGRFPDLDLPPESSIRAWIGAGWNDCLRRALLPTVSDGDFAYEAIEQSFTLDELIELALACAADLQKPTRPSMQDLYAWVRRPDVAERFPRRPMTDHAFKRYGGWLEVLEKAREVARERGLDSPLLKTTPRVYTYTKSEMKAALTEVSARLQERIGDRSPRYSEYQGERLVVQEESIAAGCPRALPNPYLISQTFGSWDEALIAAGLTPLGGSATKSNFRPRNSGESQSAFTREEKAAVLCRGWAEIGRPFVRERFVAWQEGKIAEAAALGSSERMPSVWVIEREFGGWRRACRENIPGYVPPRRWWKRLSGSEHPAEQGDPSQAQDEGDGQRR